MLNYFPQRQTIFGQVSSSKMHTDFTWRTYLSSEVSVERRLIHTWDFYPPSSPSAPLSCANRTLTSFFIAMKPLESPSQLYRCQLNTSLRKKNNQQQTANTTLPEYTLLSWESESSTITCYVGVSMQQLFFLVFVSKSWTGSSVGNRLISVVSYCFFILQYFTFYLFIIYF